MTVLLWLVIAAALLTCMACADAPADPLARWDDPHDWSDR